MSEYGNPVTVLSEQEALLRLSSLNLGRIVTRVGEVVDIFPVNYVLDQGDVVLRTAEGTKFAELVISSEVLFEADHHTDTEAWSVVMRGTARPLRTEAEIEAAEALPLRPMVPTIKRNFVRITPSSITGRAFALAPEPRRDGPQDY